MTNFIAYVEDPGAANFLVGLKAVMTRAGHQLELYADGFALRYLEERGETPSIRDKGQTAEQLLLGKSVLITGTSENQHSFELELIDAAANMSVTSAAIVDAPTSLSERFRGLGERIFNHRPKHIICSYLEIRDYYAKQGFEPDKVILIRNPHFDELEERKKKFQQLDYTAKREELFGLEASKTEIVVFVCEISDGLKSENFLRSSDYTLSGWKNDDGNFNSKLRTNIVFEEVLSALSNIQKSIPVIARLHPKDDIEIYRQYEKYLFAFSVNEDPLEIVYFADKVIGLTSNLLSVAALLGKDALSVIPREAERNWLPKGIDPPIPIVWTQQQLGRAIEGILTGPKIKKRKRADQGFPTLFKALLSLN